MSKTPVLAAPAGGTHAVAGFRKTLPAPGAAAEIAGWAAVADHLPVPPLLAQERRAGKITIVYEDVFASGRCRFLLGDLIGKADQDQSLIPGVSDFIDAICRSLCDAVGKTGRPQALGECVPALHMRRLRRGGRIDQWYLADRAGHGVDLRDFAGWELRVNGSRYRFELGRVIARTRRELSPDSRWMSASTQGDPTEPNIAVPLCWLDFEHAGRNAIVGEAANLLWYLLGMGGWLVPRYQPAVYARTLRLASPPVATPVLELLETSVRHRIVELEYTWAAGPGRRAALQRLCRWLSGDLAVAIGCPPAQIYAVLRPFLVIRMLGVIPARSLTAEDKFLLLAKLAENEHAEMTLDEFISSRGG